MKNILIKTVMQGTAKAAITNGITIGGKTGTAHIADDRHFSSSASCKRLLCSRNRRTYF